MQKFRGKKRYYKRLLNNDLDVYFDNLDFNSWFDLWHNHPDWFGYGNISWKHRIHHLSALVRRFDYLKEKLLKRTDNFQIYIMVNINDSSQDSVFIHTKNPNADNFPIQIEEYKGNINIPNLLREFIQSTGYEWFNYLWKLEDEEIPIIYIYDKNIGLPINNR